MRDLVHLHERATRFALRSTEDAFCEKLIPGRRLSHAEAAAHYENEATRSNIVRKLADQMVSRKDAYKYTIASIWREIARAHEEINGGSGERFFGSRPKPGAKAGGASVMVAQVRDYGPRATRGKEWKTSSVGAC